MKIGDNKYNLSDFDTNKKKVTEVSKNIKYNDIKRMVFRMELLNSETIDTLDSS